MPLIKREACLLILWMIWTCMSTAPALASETVHKEESSPSGTDASPGDICLYAPWGNLAIFYKSHGHANGLVRLSR